MTVQPDNERLGPAFVKLATILLVGILAPVFDLSMTSPTR